MTEGAAQRLRLYTEAQGRRWRRLVTPEGAYLNLNLASPSDRIGAAVIDFCVVTFGVVVVILGTLILLQSSGSSPGLARAMAILGSFVFRLFYYPACEFAWNGQTVGKRMMHIRVIDRRGGPLKPEAIVARNFLREIELWLPLTALLSLPATGPGDGWVAIFTTGWLLVLSSFPLFTKDVTRLGDLVAGTWVVLAPKTKLLDDLSLASGPQEAFQFSSEQLEPYGEYELDVLASVLRDRSPASHKVMPEVAERIQKKIGWAGGAYDDPHAFLLAYYKALRGHLEGRLIFGKRKLNKYNIE